MFTTKQQMIRPSPMSTPTAGTPSHHHRTSHHLDSLQTQFSDMPPPPDPRRPPPSRPMPKPNIMPTKSRISALSLRDRKSNGECSGGMATGGSFKRGGTTNHSTSLPVSASRPGIVPFVKKIHLCEICKVSCASIKTYKDHLEGQRHKKREALGKQEKQEPDPDGEGRVSFRWVGLCQL
eukprot:sb/3471773/